MTYPGGNFDPYSNTAKQSSSSKRKPIMIMAICVAVVFAIANAALVTWMVSSPDGTEANTESAPRTRPSEPVTPKYDVPSGFTLSKQGSLFTPLYPDDAGELHFMVKDDNNDETLWIAPYLMDEDTSSWEEADFMKQVEEFATQVDDESTDTGVTAAPVIGPDSETTTAYLDSLRVTSPRSGEKVTYDAYHFFDGYNLIQVGCQYQKDKEAVLTACSELMSSLEWTE